MKQSDFKKYIFPIIIMVNVLIGIFNILLLGISGVATFNLLLLFFFVMLFWALVGNSIKFEGKISPAYFYIALFFQGLLLILTTILVIFLIFDSSFLNQVKTESIMCRNNPWVLYCSEREFGSDSFISHPLYLNLTENNLLNDK